MKITKSSSAAVAVLTLLVAPLAAQMGAPPSPELAKFDRILGSWTGEGEVIMAAGQAGMPWTATTKYSKVLNGYFIREDSTIDLGAGGKIHMLGFYGWDKDNNNFVQLSTSSMGGAYAAPVDWTSTDTFTSMATMRAFNPMSQAIERSLERWKTTIEKDGTALTIIGEKAVDGAPWFSHVTGKFTKAKADVAAVDANAAPMMPPADEMKSLEKLRGMYDVEGSMRWGSGADEAMSIRGTERMDMIFGGQVLSMRTIGEPAGDMPADSKYEGLAYTSWDAVDKCYTTIMVSNMGEQGHFKMWPDGKHFVMYWTGKENGVPMVKRTVMHCDDAGKATKVVSHQLAGSVAPFVCFEATYKARG
ncbi:MAG TPA: DUF1579 family protein [Planctomycetota bacterium]|nr:DUF1579 family protein [Planctomycetota bacterium]